MNKQGIQEVKNTAKIVLLCLGSITIVSTSTWKLVDVLAKKIKKYQTRQQLVKMCPLVFPIADSIPHITTMINKEKEMSLSFQQELLYLNDELALPPDELEKEREKRNMNQKIDTLKCLHQALQAKDILQEN